VTVDVIDRRTGSIQRAEISLAEETGCAEIRLELTPGASAVQVTVRDNNAIAESIEVPAQPGEQVCVEFRRDSRGKVRASAPNRDFLVLPDEEPPDPLLLRPPDTKELDLVVLVDGTCTHPLKDSTGNKGVLEYLLAPALAQTWQEIANLMMEFVSRIEERYPKLWMMTVAFGDEPMPMLSNTLLLPSYLVYPVDPDRRILGPAMAGQLATQLRRLPYTPGGDYVDALADGLRACEKASWRQNSRKLLLLFGQSPGYSMLEESDGITNLLPRKACIEEEIAALHHKGVEVITIFHHPPEADDLYGVNRPDVINRSRQQYEWLASLPGWSNSTSDFNVEKLAAAWLDPLVTVIARGPSPGILVGA
jgi:hypothetical protein